MWLPNQRPKNHPIEALIHIQRGHHLPKLPIFQLVDPQPGPAHKDQVYMNIIEYIYVRVIYMCVCVFYLYVFVYHCLHVIIWCYLTNSPIAAFLLGLAFDPHSHVVVTIGWVPMSGVRSFFLFRCWPLPAPNGGWNFAMPEAQGACQQLWSKRQWIDGLLPSCLPRSQHPLMKIRHLDAPGKKVDQSSHLSVINDCKCYRIMKNANLSGKSGCIIECWLPTSSIFT